MSVRIVALAVILALSLAGGPAMAAKKKAPTVSEQQAISQAYFKAAELMSNQQWEGAISGMTGVIDNPKTSKDLLANALADRGACYTNLYQTDKAVADLNKALEIKPDLQNALYERARALAMQLKHEAAVADLTKALVNAQPTIATAGYYYNRAVSYMYLSKRAEAKADFAKAVQLNPKLVIPEYYRDL